MALIDPCLALPFDASCSQLADEREAADRDDDQPLTPTTPTTPTADMTAPSSLTPSSPSSSFSAAAGAGAAVSPSFSSAASAAVAGPSSATAASLAPPSSSPGSVVSMTALPTVLQSVFSYIFTDHHAAQQQSAQLQPAAAPALAASASAAGAASASAASAFPSSSSPFSSSHAGSASAFASSSPASPASDAGSPAAPHSHSFPVVPLSPTSSSCSSSSSSSSCCSARHCAILDLDETLLHSFFPDKVTPYQYQYMVMRCKAQEEEERAGRLPANQRSLYQVDVGDGTIVVLMLRPHLRPFLLSLFGHYDVGVWSAGGKLYVDAICRVLFPPESGFRPLFQLCWDDVQVETNGLSSYTKPLTTLIARYAQLQLHTLFLVDNRKENGLHFPSQLVIAPDYLPRPWEWNGDRDRDLFLMDDAMLSIHGCVQSMKHREAELTAGGAVALSVHQSFSLSSRLAGDDIGVSLGGGHLLLDSGDDSMREEEDEDEDGSEMGLDDAAGEVDDVEGEDERGELPAEEQDEPDADDSSDMDDDQQQPATDLYMIDVQQQRRPAQRRQQQKSAA